jgi:hypothetical protein
VKQRCPEKDIELEIKTNSDESVGKMKNQIRSETGANFHLIEQELH